MQDKQATPSLLKTMGLVVHDLGNLSRKSKIVIEPPVTLGATIVATGAAIGAYTYMRGGTIHSLTKIGRFCSVAPGVEIGPGNHPTTFLSTHPFQYGASGFDFWPAFKGFNHGDLSIPKEVAKAAPIIGNDVWIGAQVFIPRGVTIGDGAVIAAGSVVTKDVQPYEIVGGAPAKHIRFRFEPEIIEALLELKWWDYEPATLEGVPFSDIKAAIEEISRRKAAGLLQRIESQRFFIQDGQVDLCIPVTPQATIAPVAQ